MSTATDSIIIEQLAVALDDELVVAHGGVDMEPSETTFATLDASTKAAFQVLAHGDGGILAALGSVAVMEDDPAFNAGLGSVLTRTGVVETDGAVSSGWDGRATGVGAVPGIRRPAALAYRLMQEERTVLLAGSGAAEYAVARGFEIEDLVTDEQRLALDAYAADPTRSIFTGRPVPTETVGCLVLDALGIASASSTGGLLGKLPGRIGDSCVPGGGFWTDRRFGVLCSGSGEAAITAHVAGTVARRAADLGLAEAIRTTLDELVLTTGTICAIVGVDTKEGLVATGHNGGSFPVAVRQSNSAHRLGAQPRRNGW
ncbi:isoaspartyl peptidase/L-asparaginase [Leifsonia sp. H3M29-4]|uniref:isoaspartyl peptidase/L-asparaginase n=1 Tax=Salinibacterium metalliresistens TaxID=3031321 RepID=UPI0023D9D618|nr:isoaspartyl peptidase/L-asparaginase [Salinibacterium metalliresistens]MDF1480179.1 isoaspartyl peptidase/L-asparaginase [Salinibacterium metalliresistens]